MTRRRRAVATGVAAVVASGCGSLALTACSSQNFIGGPSVTTVAVARSATVDVRYVHGFGKILVSGAGTTLYLLTSDPPGGSDCTGPCSLAWPPLEASGTLKAGPGVNPALLSSFGRSDGGRQVLYNKHALYTFEEDTGPGMVTGQGVQTYGGTWWVVSPRGQGVK
jgi:predicted lipoprotein with Yx(FWY)xxD motif